jgi:hypothetical protein
MFELPSDENVKDQIDDNETVIVPRKRLLHLLEWMQADHDNLTCSDVCDKTWEMQGCPSGTCALESGKAELRWWFKVVSEE